MEPIFAALGLGAGGYWLYKKLKNAPHPFQDVKGGVTGKPYKVRVIDIKDVGAGKQQTVEVWSPAGTYGPHLDTLILTYAQTGSDKATRKLVGTGSNAVAQMVTDAGQDFGVKKPTTVSGAPDHVVPLVVSGTVVGHAEINHAGDHFGWSAKVGADIIGGSAPTPGTAAALAIGAARRRATQRRRR
jgi:hypothetical protein